jgi:hypothetical protein
VVRLEGSRSRTAAIRESAGGRNPIAASWQSAWLCLESHTDCNSRKQTFEPRLPITVGLPSDSTPIPKDCPMAGLADNRPIAAVAKMGAVAQ